MFFSLLLPPCQARPQTPLDEFDEYDSPTGVHTIAALDLVFSDRTARSMSGHDGRVVDPRGRLLAEVGKCRQVITAGGTTVFVREDTLARVLAKHGKNKNAAQMTVSDGARFELLVDGDDLLALLAAAAARDSKPRIQQRSDTLSLIFMAVDELYFAHDAMGTRYRAMRFAVQWHGGRCFEMVGARFAFITNCSRWTPLRTRTTSPWRTCSTLTRTPTSSARSSRPDYPTPTRSFCSFVHGASIFVSSFRVVRSLHLFIAFISFCLRIATHRPQPTLRMISPVFFSFSRSHHRHHRVIAFVLFSARVSTAVAFVINCSQLPHIYRGELVWSLGASQ